MTNNDNVLKEIFSSIDLSATRSSDIQLIVEKIVDKIKKYNVCDITTEIKLLVRETGENAINVIKEILSWAEKQYGEVAFYIINKDTLPLASGVKEVEGLSKIKEYVKTHGIPRIISLVVAKKTFLDKLTALKRIFEEIYETNPNWIISALAIDQLNELWPKIELFFIKEANYRPPINELLPLFHAASTFRNKEEALLFMEDFIRRLGLVARSWKRTRGLKHLINQFSKVGEKNEKVEIIIKALYFLLNKESSLNDFCATLISLFPLDEEHKEAMLITTGCQVSEGFLRKMEEEIDINRALRELSHALMNAEKTWAPEVSIPELLGYSWLTYVSSRILFNWIKDKINAALNEITQNIAVIPDELLDILKLSIVLALSRYEFKNMDCRLLVRMLLAIRKRFLEYPIAIFSNIIDAVREFSERDLSIAIYLQRILEIHGQLIYLYLLNQFFKPNAIKKVISVQYMIQSRFGIISRKVISFSMKNEEALRIVNERLAKSNFSPHGVTAPLQWELSFTSIEKLGEMVNLAKRYMEDCGVEPNKLLVMLDQLLRLHPRIKRVKEVVKKRELSSLKEAFIDISRESRLLKLIMEMLRSIYGTEEAPLIKKIKLMISNYHGTLNESWERVLIRDYESIIRGKTEEKAVTEIPNMVKDYLKNGDPVALLVIDGLRIDDFLVKLKDMLITSGFILIKEESLISLLPSITAISRRAIFGGQNVLEVFSPYPSKQIRAIKREDELLKENYSNNAIYLQGAIAHVKNIIMALERSNGLKLLNAIVLSELEKAAHGAAEGFLAEISMEYAGEIAKLSELIAKSLCRRYDRDAILIIASDHGLGLFTKETETDIKAIFKALARKGLIDPAHEPYIVERYALIPAISHESVIVAKNFVEVEFKSDVHAIVGSELGYKKISLKLKGQDLMDSVPADNVLILFPKGRKRFLVERRRKRRVVLHGGLLPVETVVPFAVFKYEK